MKADESRFRREHILPEVPWFPTVEQVEPGLPSTQAALTTPAVRISTHTVRAIAPSGMVSLSLFAKIAA